MQTMEKPRLGVLALMLEGYEPLFPGITRRQHAYVEEVLASLKDVADCVFPRVALNRADIEEMTAQYNQSGLDGILIFLLSYSQAVSYTHLLLMFPLKICNGRTAVFLLQSNKKIHTASQTICFLNGS